MFYSAPEGDHARRCVFTALNLQRWCRSAWKLRDDSGHRWKYVIFAQAVIYAIIITISSSSSSVSIPSLVIMQSSASAHLLSLSMNAADTLPPTSLF